MNENNVKRDNIHAFRYFPLTLYVVRNLEAVLLYNTEKGWKELIFCTDHTEVDFITTQNYSSLIETFCKFLLIYT